MNFPLDRVLSAMTLEFGKICFGEKNNNTCSLIGIVNIFLRNTILHQIIS